MKTLIIINIIATLVAVGIAVSALAKVTRTERTVAEHSEKVAKLLEWMEDKDNIFTKSTYDSILKIQVLANQSQSNQ